MWCPRCKGNTKAVQSVKAHKRVLRQRVCDVCKNRFFTEEVESKDPGISTFLWNAKEESKKKSKEG